MDGMWTGKRVALLLLPGLGLIGLASAEWLALCSKCISPTIFSKSGIGTANAVAEAKVTEEEAKAWCQNWQPGGALAACVKEQLAEHGGKAYRATADCTTGRITAVDGKTYLLAGVWPNDIGQGRTRWRDPVTGGIVGRDNASGGLGISQQWEVLCPGVVSVRTQTAARSAAPPPAPDLCGGQANCADTLSFAATITDFRTSAAGATRMLGATVRFQNKLNRPLILGFASDSGVAIDDQGNRYVVYGNNSVRGIGMIAGNSVDPKFILQPGESSDGRFEYLWRPNSGAIIGTSFELELTIREINPVAANQFRLGREHALRFRGLGNAPVSAAPAGPAPVISATPASVPAAAQPAVGAAPATAPGAPPVDACGGKPRCYHAGPFAAEVVQMTGSQVRPGAHHVMRLNVRFRNLSGQPLILGYKSQSGRMTDNHGNPYYWGRAGTVDGSASGIGTVTRAKADPSFVLNSGESRAATFQLIRYSPGRTALGTGFSYDVVIEQLEVLPGGQVRSLREYSLTFPDLAVSLPRSGAQQSESVGEAAQKLRDLFKGRKK